MKCHACGQDNADSALFCTACRRPLVAPAKVPARLEPMLAAAAPSIAAAAPGDTDNRNRFAPPNAGVGAAVRMGDDSQVLTDEEARAAVIGDSNTQYYLDRFDRIAHGERGGWHWPGFLVTWYWMLYRKMWVPALIYFFAPYVVGMLLGGVTAAAPKIGGALSIAWFAAWLIGPGLLVNGWYYKHCMNRIRDVRARGGSKEQMLARLEAAGGTSNITVIVVALLGLVFVIGILAAIALPAYQAYTIKAKVADAVVEGAAVAQAVGRQYEATGQLPTDIDRIASQLPQQSKYVRGIEIDGNGVLTVHIEATASIAGSIQLTPSAGDNRHLTWSCSTRDLAKYVPRSCRD